LHAASRATPFGNGFVASRANERSPVRPLERNVPLGSHVNIPARQRHRVDWTDPDQPTVWLAVFPKPEPGV
jgi:hypothetical protein